MKRWRKQVEIVDLAMDFMEHIAEASALVSICCIIASAGGVMADNVTITIRLAATATACAAIFGIINLILKAGRGESG